MLQEGIINRYKKFLPPVSRQAIVSLCEGNTPLIPAVALPKELGLKNTKIYFKFEGLNPTGSFKDRGMTMAVSKAVEAGSKAIICASTGNTSASAAAYAARCGLKCYVLIPEGKIATGKLLQAYRYGATVITIQGNFDEALSLVQEMGKSGKVTVVNSVNPYRIAGQKTAAFEIVDALGTAPDYHALPVGNAGNITAYWAGYQQYRETAQSKTAPKMLGFQAAGAAPIVKGKIVTNPDTIATAIRIGNPASWKAAEAARDESGGIIQAVTDTQITWAYNFLAQHEGVFVEPASAASIAGIKKLAQKNYFKPGTTIVATLTGNGLKDPDFAMSFENTAHTITPTMAALEKIIV